MTEAQQEEALFYVYRCGLCGEPVTHIDDNVRCHMFTHASPRYSVAVAVTPDEVAAAVAE